jgi:hypothetical protein
MRADSFSEVFMPSAEAIEKQMEDILSRPEFSIGRDRILNQVMKWIGEWLARLKLPFQAGDFSSAALVVWVITAVILALLVFLFVWGISRFLARNPRVSRREGEGRQEIMTAEIALQRAREASARGAYGEGIRWLFISLLWTLEDQAFLSVHDAKTNRQYIQELKRNHYPQLAAFQELANSFNRIRYGGQRAGEEDFSRWVKRIKGLREGGDCHEEDP